jgi:hypothetical protein
LLTQLLVRAPQPLLKLGLNPRMVAALLTRRQDLLVTSSMPLTPPADAPDSLKALWPLVLKWGPSDDLDREQLVENASDAELQFLVDAVNPQFAAINAYLDETSDAEHAVAFGDLAQAAMEARFEVDRRN